MPATVTLAQTQFAQTVRRADSQVALASTAGITAGTALYSDGELMSVVSLGVSPMVNVRRGQGGSFAVDHTTGNPVWIGTPDQFYSIDPVGRPHQVVLVSPWINVKNGSVWFAMGDVEPSGSAHRWWQKQVYTDSHSGPVVTSSFSPTASN